MTQLRLLEHYTSIQGEGPRVGTLTQFVRFAGCNLRCPSWPCDTPEAIDPHQFTKEQTLVEANDLSHKIRAEADRWGAVNICLTGGEPLVQNREALDGLIHRLNMYGYSVEMFSNGTLPYSAMMLTRCKIVMDWKLFGSGELATPQGRLRNVQKMSAVSDEHVIKFTVRDEADLQQAVQLYRNHNLDDFWKFRIFVGPVYDKMDPAQIVEFVKAYRLPWKLNLQTHKYIYGNVRSV